MIPLRWRTVVLAGAVALLAACPPPGDLELVTASVPPGNVDSAYAVPLETAGGTAPLHFEVIGGDLPAGVDLDPDQGALHGTPVEAGVLSFTVRVSDARGARAEQAFVLKVFANPPPRILTATAPTAVLGRPYSLGLQVVDGKAPYAWSATALPPGLELAAGGVLSGSATQAGAFQVALAVEDANGQRATAALLLRATTEVTFTPAALPDATAGAPYAVTFEADGGIPPYQFAVVGGALPPALALDGGTGALAGTPEDAGSYGFAVGVRDQSGQAPSARYTLVVR